MDIVLEYADPVFARYMYFYPTSWPVTFWGRQLFGLIILTFVAASSLYLSVATASFYLVFDQKSIEHPLFIKSQVRKEIQQAMTSIFLVSVPTAFCFLMEVRCHSRLYDGDYSRASQYGYAVWEAVCYILFTDMLIYWMHRGLHLRRVYKYVHKLHHRYKVPTPFAGQSCSSVESLILSSPYHIFPFLFALEKRVFLIMFCMINFWTILIHSGEFNAPKWTWPYITSAVHHDIHHLQYHYNFGQYLTLWDHIGGSYRQPVPSKQRQAHLIKKSALTKSFSED